jgi:hypothetical protein
MLGGPRFDATPSPPRAYRPLGVEGIEIVPTPGWRPNTTQTEFNTALSKILSAAEHAIAHLKAWRMLSTKVAGTGHTHSKIPQPATSCHRVFTSSPLVNKPPARVTALLVARSHSERRDVHGECGRISRGAQ